MKVILGSKWEIYILFIGFALFVVGVLWLGMYLGNSFSDANIKAVYDQGFKTGEASGMHKMQNQCYDQLLAMKDNCKGWYNPSMRFGLVDLNITTSDNA